MNLIRKDWIVKTLAYALLLVLIAALETSVLSGWRIFGAAPELLVFIAAAAAVYEGPVAAVLCGFFAGLLLDGLGTGSLWWNTVALTGMTAVIWAVSPLIFRRRVLTVMMWGALMQFLCEFARFFITLYLFSKSGLSPVVTVILPRMLYSAALSPLVILPTAFLYKRYTQEPSIFR